MIEIDLISCIIENILRKGEQMNEKIIITVTRVRVNISCMWQWIK